jgi:asparagine synthase (glutamine-hydrolysing)
MGAIAVLLSRAGPPDPETARQMLAAAPHRGDREAVEVIGQVVLAACNDADWVTATLARHDGQLAVFCGSLDNDADLRADLRREGAPEPAARTPAATLLAASSQWGEDAVRRARGSFAGAITDGRTLTCFRDQFGARPLFHHDGADGFFAATEVKQVLAGASIPREPDLDHLHGVLFGGLSLSTAYRGVERIPKWTIVSAGAQPGLTSRQYWDPSACVETARLGPEEAVEGTLEALDRAVSRVLTGRDVILLSGGLDSPSLAACAVRAQGRADPVQALTAVYPGHPSADEREWTQMAADHLGMPLHPYVADAGSLDDIEHWVAVLDGPVDVVSIPESAESYSAARALGGRTVINGELAEMLFESRAYLLDHLLSHGRLIRAASMLAARRKAGRTRVTIARQIIRAVAPPRLVTAYRKRHPVQPRGLPSWVDARRLTAARRDPPMWSLSPRRRWVEMQTAPFIGPGIGFEADEICAACCGVDNRRPFADVDLWEFVLSLPAEVKFPNQRPKPLLRETMRGLLPDALIDRRDKTFFDEFHLAKADYATLKRLLMDSPQYLKGIDYGLLRDRLEHEDMRVYELQWARNVARVHAFLSQW